MPTASAWIKDRDLSLFVDLRGVLSQIVPVPLVVVVVQLVHLIVDGCVDHMQQVVPAAGLVPGQVATDGNVGYPVRVDIRCVCSQTSGGSI